MNVNMTTDQRYLLTFLVGMLVFFLTLGAWFRPTRLDPQIYQVLALSLVSLLMFLFLPEPLRFSRQSLWLVLAGAALAGTVYAVGLPGTSQDVRVTSSNGLTGYVAGLALYSVAIPVFEEKFCRDVMFNGLRRRVNVWLSALVVSVLFALAHRGNEIFTFVFSMGLCALTVRGVSTWDRACFHGAFNLTLWSIWIYQSA